MPQLHEIFSQEPTLPPPQKPVSFKAIAKTRDGALYDVEAVLVIVESPEVRKAIRDAELALREEYKPAPDAVAAPIPTKARADEETRGHRGAANFEVCFEPCEGTALVGVRRGARDLVEGRARPEQRCAIRESQTRTHAEAAGGLDRRALREVVELLRVREDRGRQDVVLKNSRPAPLALR